MTKPKSQSGQSLVEILVALGIALLVVVALVRATAISLKGSGFSKAQARGTRYAQEAIEWIRNQRDQGWSNLASRTPGTGSTTYCLSDLSFWPAAGECSDFSLDSQYKREATLTYEDEGKIEVVVTVKWLEVGGERQSRLTTYFTNWRGGLVETVGTPTPVSPTPTSTTAPIPTPTPTPGGGEVFNTFVARVSLTDGSVPCSESELYDSTFGTTSSINRAYSESSRGAVSLSGSVTTVNLNRSKSELNAHCSVYNNTTIADWVNTAAGIDPVDYEKIMYILPSGTCNWSGNLHYQGKYLYTTNCQYPKILAHEMGHSIGTYHAATLGSDYGDMSCVMGGGIGPMVQYNAPHRVGLGWVNASTVTSGTYTLVATERDDYVILRTDKDASNYWYFSYRAPIGEDDDLGTEYVNKVSVHYFSKNPTGGVSSRSYLLATLDVGESFTEGSMTVTCLSKTAETAEIQIDI